MAKEAEIYNGEKTVSSINCVGKTGLIYAPPKTNETRPFSYTTYKNTVKMD